MAPDPTTPAGQDSKADTLLRRLLGGMSIFRRSGRYGLRIRPAEFPSCHGVLICFPRFSGFGSACSDATGTSTCRALDGLCSTALSLQGPCFMASRRRWQLRQRSGVVRSGSVR